MPPRQRTQTYYGYAFESYCTSDSPTRAPESAPKDAPPGWSGDVDTNVQWCSVVRTKLGDTRLILGGEVDCVRGACARAGSVRFQRLLFIRAPAVGSRSSLSA